MSGGRCARSAGRSDFVVVLAALDSLLLQNSLAFLAWVPLCFSVYVSVIKVRIRACCGLFVAEMKLRALCGRLSPASLLFLENRMLLFLAVPLMLGSRGNHLFHNRRYARNDRLYGLQWVIIGVTRSLSRVRRQRLWLLDQRQHILIRWSGGFLCVIKP